MTGVEDNSSLVQDGKIDHHGNPADKAETGRWKACFFILGNECCERLAYYGMSSNLVNYFKDSFNQSLTAANKNVNNWSGTCYVMPLVGAFLADTYLGRYWVIASFSIIYVLGLVLLTLAASVTGLKPVCSGKECQGTSAGVGLTFFALYLIALGTGGIKPCVSSFGADQFDESDEKEKKSKNSFFNYFYCSINVGALIASSVIVYIQVHIGWGWGFGVPAVAMALAVVSFFSGSRLYRYQKPGGNALKRMAQVIVAASRKYNVKVPEDQELLYDPSEGSGITGSRKLEHTETLRCLDKAAVPVETDDIKGTVNSWKLCSVTQVEELKAMARILPVWATGIVFSAVYSQMSSFFVTQGDTMDQHLGPKFKVPSATLSLIDTLSVIFWVPVYDKLIVPLARKYTGNEKGFTTLQRMGIGLVISIFSMLAAGIVEASRLNIVRKHNYYDLETVPMSIFWQIPQYFIIGCAEVFTFAGQLDFFYSQAPDAMRSWASALSLLSTAFGNYLSSLLVTIVTSATTRNGKPGWIPERNLNRGHLDYFFWMLAILSILNALVYVWIAKRYTYKKVKASI